MRRMFSLGALVMVSAVGVALASAEIPLPVGDVALPETRPEPARHVVESNVGLLPVDEGAGQERSDSDKSGAAPKVVDDYFTVKANVALVVAAAGGFLANDFDPEGDALTATVITDNVDHGTLAAFANGSFNYTPDAGYVGYDYFDYRVTDGTNTTETGRVHLPVVVTDRAPVAQAENYAIARNSPLAIVAPGFLANDFDPDGDSVAATSIMDNVDHGTLAAFADGHFTYTPATGYSGTDSFDYRILANGVTTIGTVTITVFDPNRAPLATPDNYYAPTGGSITIAAAAGLLRNDLDPDGDTFSATLIANGVDHGILSAFADGHFTYTPTVGYSGIDQFTYQIRDANAATASALVTIYVGVATEPASAAPLPPAEALRFGMSLPAPNPFNPATRIDFRVDGQARTTLRVFDVRGALVRTLVDEDLPAGDHTVQWDGRDDQGAEAASGAYFVALASGADFTSTKLVLVK